ncbi:MAG: hydroxymethylglutaryl-CoA reductase, degradative [Acidobacteriota bacterium]|nr:hydroxymethylglutaryl-CoA reductase, degradative [Acidobacteriota bacterium]
MAEQKSVTSRISGFYKHPVNRRLQMISETGLLSETSQQYLDTGGRLDLEVADRMSENVIATHGLPLALALNFRINGRDVLVPMSVEEPSIVAAASNAARLVRLSGGFFAEASPSVMTTQIQLDEVPEAEHAVQRVMAARDDLLAAGNQAIPNMVRRGGGCRDLDVRVLDAEEGIVVVHLYVEVGNAMGANLVDTVAEAVAPRVQKLIGGRIGLRILSNLPLRRTVKVTARVSGQAVGGEELAAGIARASRFAELDPFRAVTHNKGIMNGIDAVALATGQDWRSIEAGAHAFAALGGSYKPLAVWRATEDGLEGTLEVPMAVGTVGGSTQVHPGVRTVFELMQITDAGELAEVIATAGLASNLAALKALAGEGIQRGHMRLHHRKAALMAETEAARSGQAEGERR